MSWRDAHCKTTFDPYKLNPSFVKALYNVDNGRLRIRWSQRDEMWHIERKVGRMVSYIPRLGHYRKRFLNPPTNSEFVWVENDSWIRARDGYILIDTIYPRPHPDHWLIRNLEYYRLERWGGGEKAAQKLEQMEQVAWERKLQRDRDRWYAIAEDVHDSWNWESGQRVAVPSNYAPKDTTLWQPQ